jgi:small subunit ribosomal protein S20
MPIIKSAKKALRQSIKRAERNVGYKKKIKNLVKEIHSLVDQGKAKDAKKLLPELYKTLDKVAKAGYIKKGNADRRKSRLTKPVEKTNR